MLFNSLPFLVFFPVVTLVFFSLPQAWRRYWLLAASCYFYMAFVPAYILILFGLILVDFAAGLMIERADGPGRKKLCLILSLGANLGILGFFKYFNFLEANLAKLGGMLGTHIPDSYLHVILPIGLSFHTFQSMSYVIEVYRGRWKAERNLGIYALYVLFYPQMIAGPIERPYQLLAQLHQDQPFDHDRVVSGLRLMLWGFFKKLVIADQIAVMVKYVYGDPAAHSGLELLVASYGFAFQIYCDFSGYSDIAIGAARVMGIDLMRNFDRPYAARSVGEFWHRWHISLSTWFRDYLYIPLGGSRVLPGRWVFNVMVVFVLSGLWHGAAWTFVFWGAWHGAGLVLSRWTEPGRRMLGTATGLDRWPWLQAVIATVATFHVVLIGWVLFRAAGLQEALYVLRRLLPGRGFFGEGFHVGLTWFELGVLVAAIAGMDLVEWARERWTGWLDLRARPRWMRWSVYYAAAAVIFAFGKFSSQQFIYFQF